MTNDEILAALENTRMDLERAIETLVKVPAAFPLGLDNLRTFRDRVQHNINFLKGKTNER